MPCDYRNYPADWKTIRAAIIERAHNHCEACHIPNYAIFRYDEQGRWECAGGSLYYDDLQYTRCYREAKAACDIVNETEPHDYRVCVLTISHTDVIVANDGTASSFPSGGTPPYTFAWSDGSTTQAISGLASGTYTVTITDANGCTTTGSATVLGATATAASMDPVAVQVYPNPCRGSLTIAVDQATEVTVVNALGSIVLQSKVLVQQSIDLQAAGIYFVRAQQGDKVVVTKVIRQE